MEEKPIYDFPKLKQALERLGVQVGKAKPYVSVGTIEVLPELIGTQIKYDADGIYYVDDNGVSHKGFLYKQRFFFHDYGDKMPKFHIRLCSAIQDFGRDAYRFANDEPIKVIARDRGMRGREIEVKNLQLCSYCASMVLFSEDSGVRNSTDFVEILKAGEPQEEQEELELDIFGYVRDWERISTEYRESKEYTCEKCGLHIDDPMLRFYMHTHHKDGNKQNNKLNNLQCLCVRCHANIDESHQHNFSHGANAVILRDFNKLFPEQKRRIQTHYFVDEDDLPF